MNGSKSGKRGSRTSIPRALSPQNLWTLLEQRQRAALVFHHDDWSTPPSDQTANSNRQAQIAVLGGAGGVTTALTSKQLSERSSMFPVIRKIQGTPGAQSSIDGPSIGRDTGCLPYDPGSFPRELMENSRRDVTRFARVVGNFLYFVQKLNGSTHCEALHLENYAVRAMIHLGQVH